MKADTKPRGFQPGSGPGYCQHCEPITLPGHRAPRWWSPPYFRTAAGYGRHLSVHHPEAYAEWKAARS